MKEVRKDDIVTIIKNNSIFTAQILRVLTSGVNYKRLSDKVTGFASYNQIR